MNKPRTLTLADNEAKKLLQARSRRDFLIGGVSAVAAIGGYRWITKAKEEDGTPWPERRVLEFDDRLSEDYLSDAHLMPTFSAERIGHLKANGDVGLSQPFNKADWKLQFTPADGVQAIELSLSDITRLPKVEMITQFCCIEGWNQVVHWGGARLSDFARKFLPPGQKMSKYVYMATDGEDYYVGLDSKSALHPQTLLAYEQNGKPLAYDHGAPLRLAIPVKYGIKNIKRIGLMNFTNQKPSDYWAEEGYDWFAGL